MAEQTGAEKLRAIVAWLNQNEENFLDRFGASELIRLWEHASTGDVREFADTWSEKEIAEALRPSKLKHIERALRAARSAVEKTLDPISKSCERIIRHDATVFAFSAPTELHEACAMILDSLAGAERDWQAGLAPALPRDIESARKTILHAFLAALAVTDAEAEACADNAEACL